MNKQASSSLRILWVKSGPLHPLDTGGKKRTHSMLVELSKGHEVTYLSLKERRLALEPVEPEDGYAARKLWVPWRESGGRSLRFFAELLGNLFFSSLPYALAKYRSGEMESEIARLCAGEQFDLVVCDFLSPAVNFLRIRDRLGVPTVLFQHNVEAQIWKRLAAGKRNPVARWYFGLQAARMARWERRLSQIFDGVIMVSPEDTELARKEYGLENVLGEVPAGVDTDYFQPGRRNGGQEPTIGFLGSMDWMPNIEAVKWFADDIFPRLKDAIPGVRLMVIGRRPPASIRALASRDSRIEVTGTVDDVRPYLDRCDLLTVPLLSGGGTRIKIMEGLAAGLPVVATTVGAEGLGLVDGEHLLIADSAEEFAAAVREVISDQGLRQRLSASGRDLVLAEYGWARAADVFMEHCQKVLSRLVTGSELRQNQRAR
jgi:glycosyltransferase involved in cell wall biosynthesis